jgi:cyclase
MLQKRIIPVLLLQNQGIVKTQQFKNPIYLGDPLNAVMIFNSKEVDELILIDINASKENRSIDPNFVKEISSECLMPLAVGGGISSLAIAEKLIQSGAEKVILNRHVDNNFKLISEISNKFGNQSVVVSIDLKKIDDEYQIFIQNGSIKVQSNLYDYLKKCEDSGAGEIFINLIDRDGMMNGMDLELINNISLQINIPLIACGGAGSAQDLKQALKTNVSAIACGSLFVFHGKKKAVLISYPSKEELQSIFN